MKKIVSICVIAAAFALVGCAKKVTPVNQDVTAKETCKGKKCKHHKKHHHHDKLGVEKAEGTVK